MSLSYFHIFHVYQCLLIAFIVVYLPCSGVPSTHSSSSFSINYPRTFLSPSSSFSFLRPLLTSSFHLPLFRLFSFLLLLLLLLLLRLLRRLSLRHLNLPFP